ncbi:soluble quino protein glucose dehydrogenase [Pseudovirgaria hyperparasitica]|uniref:Soluble quino protein glucose dehydrogenase n=1 Tax=Pseudovirgaria hyperparasitica TaxID=470096 RepID=A0A6A6WIY7_9PEZI|nr:soluble quino protein glucose dehydrogenase [Pseudovirgaria hyperparasitica]KAF2761677.1 soluble quino protein glucose dehydrogenase [Pseudovirgaria hyperparasitica]
MKSILLAAGLASFATLSNAQDCASTLSANYTAPILADGYRATLIANQLETPRSLKFDSAGHLLMLQRSYGIVSFTLTGTAPCLTVSSTKDILANTSVNHGLELSRDGRTLYASDPNGVYAWNYDAERQELTSDARRVVTTGSTADGHDTRTLLMSRQVDNMLLVHWGSQGNIDPQALNRSTGISSIKAFNVSDPSVSYDYASEGILMGWGLRNSVGFGENPVTGGIFSVENNVDELKREGRDIHKNNPAEELNFHGYLNGTEYANQGANFGYPSCFPAWDASSVPGYDGLKTGQQFAIGDQNDTVNDNICREGTVPPQLSFAAHMAPLDIKFNTEATVAWVTFHGSWNRDDPQGYKLSAIPFDNSTGLPLAAPDSNAGYVDIMSNQDLSECPDGCFRPVSLAWNSEGMLFMTSDSTGELYLISTSDNTPLNDAPPPTLTNGGESPPTSPSEPSSTPGAASVGYVPDSWFVGLVFLVISYIL